MPSWQHFFYYNEYVMGRVRWCQAAIGVISEIETQLADRCAELVGEVIHPIAWHGIHGIHGIHFMHGIHGIHCMASIAWHCMAWHGMHGIHGMAWHP